MTLYLRKITDSLHGNFLTEQTKNWSERVILSIAILSFIVHLIIYYLVQYGLLGLNPDSELLQSPISAIYTPFSFILLYEVYLLVYYLPQSISTYITKQYEIITLIIIRRLFKDLATLELSSDWFQIQDDLQFTYDIIASVILFFLLYLFFKQREKAKEMRDYSEDIPDNIQRFIQFKKLLAVILVPILLGLAIYTLADWGISTFSSDTGSSTSFKNINNIFFDEFFTILIIVDVILLLVSFFYTDKFYKVIRNSGFIISTILIRLSFSVEGLLNTILIVSAILFGLLILVVHNKFEKRQI
jgi:hypothetical protein